MTIFDPYDRGQPATPGLNTGSVHQVSTLTPVATDGIRANRYRSGALSALAPFLGWVSIILAVAMGFAAVAATILCSDYGLTAPACTAEPVQLALAPLAVLVFGLALASIGGSLAKRRRAAGSLVVLAGGFILLAVATQWFSTSVLGLPFP